MKYHFHIIRSVTVVVIDKTLKKNPKNKALKALKLISNTCALHSVKVCIIAWVWGAQKGI